MKSWSLLLRTAQLYIVLFISGKSNCTNNVIFAQPMHFNRHITSLGHMGLSFLSAAEKYPNSGILYHNHSRRWLQSLLYYILKTSLSPTSVIPSEPVPCFPYSHTGAQPIKFHTIINFNSLLKAFPHTLFKSSTKSF